MYLTGFADEAAEELAGQIAATKMLGWRYIEARNIKKQNIHDLPQEEFERACEQLEEAGIQVNCFGSAIANWAQKITDPFDKTLEQVRRAILRMQRLGTPLIRIMSYAVLEERGPEDQMEQERFSRVRTITQMFLDEGIQPVHENCMNYGGMGWAYTLRLLENVPGLKLVFDTGNPVFSANRMGSKPYPRQSAWEFYEHVRDHIAYVHIKDGNHTPPSNEHPDGQMVYTFPGEGQGDVKSIVGDLLKRGYDGGFSMEPHMGTVLHERGRALEADQRLNLYVEYGKRFEKILQDAVSD